MADVFHGTTILSVRRNGAVALGGDGQVTLGQVIIKASARKVRRLYHDRILAGFAGATPIVRALLLLIGISPRHFVKKSD